MLGLGAEDFRNFAFCTSNVHEIYININIHYHVHGTWRLYANNENYLAYGNLAVLLVALI